jgi:hypothetical protein
MRRSASSAWYLHRSGATLNVSGQAGGVHPGQNRLGGDIALGEGHVLMPSSIFSR